MGKLSFGEIVLVIILSLSLLITLPGIIDFITDRSESNGEMPTTEYHKHEETTFGYQITYNLDGGTLVGVNPDYYTLFSEDFTLNNPTKEGYEFLGWTGSNGEEPQLTVTICTGSAGDLEFTANYIRRLDDVVLELNGSTLSWNADEKVELYDVSINGSVYVSTTSNSIDVHLLDKYFSEGKNIICIKARATDYQTQVSNEIEYVYYDLTAFDNLQFNYIYFSRLSDRYVLLNSSMQVEYSLAGEYLGGYAKNETVINLSTEEALMYGFSSGTNDKATLSLNDISIFELLQFIDAAYTGETSQNIDASGKFKFIVKDTLNTEYVPASLILNVTYNEMFTEATFYEGASVNIAECTTTNSIAVGFAGWADTTGSIFELEVILKDTDGNTVKIQYDDFVLSDNNDGFYLNRTKTTEATLNAALEGKKFYLNDDYYFTINGDFSTFMKAIYQDARNKREADEIASGNTSPDSLNIWSYKEISYEMNLNDYFFVYANDGTKITFNYTLYAEYRTLRVI